MTLYIRNREELEHLVVTMHAEGWSIRGLCRHFHMGRNTVRRILRKNRRQREEGHEVLVKRKAVARKSKLDPFIPMMKDLLERFPKLTGQRMYEELRDAGYDGGISIVRDRLKGLRPRPKREPTVRFETAPGKQGQMDWSRYIIPFTKGGKAEILCFSYILGFSRRHYIDFTLHRDFYTLIRRHQDAFQHFEGVPRQCLYDSEKTIVLRWEAGQPLMNPSFTAFITHYHCRPIICRRGSPKTKGKIEAPFLYVEKNLLNGREFRDMDDLRATGRWWLRERSDTHIHDTTHRPPLELFMEQEQAALQPLPLHPYDSSEVALKVCRFDGFIEHETNFYSVPYEYMADILSMKATENEIFIYSPMLDLIARHERLPAGACKQSELPEHRASKKVRYGLEPVRESFLALGDGAQNFLKGLEQKYPRNCGFHARCILRFKENYHCDDINKALKHAIRYHAFDSKAIERILRARARPRTLESIRNERARDELRKTLPEIKQRPLDEYSKLFLDKEVIDEEKQQDRGEDTETDKGISEDPETDKNREGS